MAVASRSRQGANFAHVESPVGMTGYVSYLTTNARLRLVSRHRIQRVALQSFIACPRPMSKQFQFKLVLLGVHSRRLRKSSLIHSCQASRQLGSLGKVRHFAVEPSLKHLATA